MKQTSDNSYVINYRIGLKAKARWLQGLAQQKWLLWLCEIYYDAHVF